MDGNGHIYGNGWVHVGEGRVWRASAGNETFTRTSRHSPVTKPTNYACRAYRGRVRRSPTLQYKRMDTRNNGTVGTHIGDFLRSDSGRLKQHVVQRQVLLLWQSLVERLANLEDLFQPYGHDSSVSQTQGGRCVVENCVVAAHGLRHREQTLG